MSFEFIEDFEDSGYDDLAYEAWVDDSLGNRDWLFDALVIDEPDDLVIPGILLPESHVPGQMDIFDALYPNEEDIPF